MLGYDNLANYYRTIHNLMFHHKYDMNVVFDMTPWEKFLEIDMIKADVKHMEDLAREQAAQQRVRR